MSKSGIYAVNTTLATAIADGATYAPNTIVRRYGQNIQMAGNGITLSGAGYYDVDAAVTVTATAVGNITARLLQDGNPVVGASSTATATAIGDEVVLPLAALVRLNCNCQDSVLTIQVSDQATTSYNLAIKVVKE